MEQSKILCLTSQKTSFALKNAKVINFFAYRLIYNLDFCDNDPRLQFFMFPAFRRKILKLKRKKKKMSNWTFPFNNSSFPPYKSNAIEKNCVMNSEFANGDNNLDNY